MNTNAEVEDQSAINTVQAASPQAAASTTCGLNYYSRLKLDSEAFERLKAKNKLRYEARKAALNELRLAGFIKEIPKKPNSL